jgi:hypothetical protein
MGGSPNSSDDAAERYLSPPPPSGVRERIASNRGTIMGAAGAMLVITAIFGAVFIFGSDGKGSGDITRAFGHVSAEDQDRLAEFGIHQVASRDEVVAMIASMQRGDATRATDKAKTSLASLQSAAAIVERIENDDMRQVLGDLTLANRRFVRSCLELVTYLRAHPGEKGGRTRSLLADVGQTARGAQRAQRRMVVRVAPYMNDAQRAELKRQRQLDEERLSSAAGQE